MQEIRPNEETKKMEKETKASELMTLAGLVTELSRKVVVQIENKLEPIQMPSLKASDAVKEPKGAEINETWPPLLNDLRIFLQEIQRNLYQIAEEVRRIEI